MPANSTSSAKDTAFVAGMAAAFGSLLMYHLLTNINKKQERDSTIYYNPPPPAYLHHDGTYLQNNRTRTAQPPDDIGDGFTQGWSMADALAAAQKESAKAAAMSPADVLRSLQKGNSRFWSGNASRPELSAFQRRALISQQFPSTAVLGCADSRVPVEIVFDQGLGDMFVVRVAGNCLGLTTEASLEYAVLHLNVKVLMVMGHEGCGAIKAAGLPIEQINQEPHALATTLKAIKAGLDESNMYLSKIVDARARDREAVVQNVKRQVIQLAEDPQILAKVNAGDLKIVGAFYEISSGIVDFFMQVARYDAKTMGPFKPSPGVQSRYNPETKELVYA